jgi:hypothetical protein
MVDLYILDTDCVSLILFDTPKKYNLTSNLHLIKINGCDSDPDNFLDNFNFILAFHPHRWNCLFNIDGS